jgi:xanthine dehydrogenase YagT iron-sulfur-binding subunit
MASPSNPSRRRFLKGVGLVGAGSALVDRLTVASTAEASPRTEAAAGPVRLALDVNGQKRQVAVETRTTLLSALRDRLDPPVTGPKLVCDQGSCGACTLLLDGKPVYSCLVLAVDVVGKKIGTVEALGSPDRLNGVQQAFVQKDGMMCGFCTPGFVVTISALLKTNPNPTLEQVREACKGNFCRCGTYPKVFEAALAAAKESQRALGGARLIPGKGS